jgi:predicted  nucleic acid-binding Zn-ribbon protein
MSSGITVDEFQALEQRVLRAVEIVKREREARAAAEAEVQALKQQLAAQHEELAAKNAEIEAQVAALKTEKQAADGQLVALNQERETVRQRVAKLLAQMEEL